MFLFDLEETAIESTKEMFRFRYMVVADERQRFMPLPDDRKPPRGVALEYPEAVLLVDPIEPEFKGEVPLLSVKKKKKKSFQ